MSSPAGAVVAERTAVRGTSALRMMRDLEVEKDREGNRRVYMASSV